MAPTRSSFNCPRCGESLPAGTDRCDACGAFIVGLPVPAERAPAKARAAVRAGTQEAGGRMTSFAWLMLVVGLLVGGAVGYALRSGSRAGGQEGAAAPAGPADMMSGAGAMGGGGMGGGGMGGGGGPASQGSAPAGMAMPPEVMQMVQKYETALAKNPKDVEANVNLGNLDFDSAQWQKAIGHYNTALEVEPKNADVRVDMAIAYHNMGDDTRARQEMERVTREQPRHVNAWFNLGVVAGSMGDKKAAIRAWEQCLKLDPNGERAAGIRDELKRMKETP